ncbi:hypothetical protein DMN91_012139 [Ooceraea biroi]|nr:hypothetical protein DMN91_012139 [Ooceraea biroi]
MSSSNESRGYVSLLYSVADKPLELWSKRVSLGGRVRRVRDDALHGDRVIEITGPQDSSVPTNIAVPARMFDVLNIRLPVLALVIKNLNLPFKFEVQIMDKKQCRRRFSFMTYNLEKLPCIGASVARVPLKLEERWNSLEMDLQALCREAYGADYEALQRLIIYPNCHLRRVYLQDRHYTRDEIPVDTYQAFLDAYMSKRGMNSVDRACQTEERCRGLLQQSKLNRSVRSNIIDTLPTEAHLSKNVYSMGRLDNLHSPNTTANLNNFSALKRNYMSLDILNSAIKTHKQTVTDKQSLTESSINDPIAENKVRDKNNNLKEEIRNTTETYKAEDPPKNSSNIKSNNILQPAASVELERIAKSQFLKLHVGETLFGDNKSPTDSHSHRIQNAGDVHIFNSRNCITRDSGNKRVQAEDNTHRVDAKCREFAPNIPFAPEFNLAKDTSKFDKMSNDLINMQSHELYTIFEDKCVKENETNITISL